MKTILELWRRYHLLMHKFATCEESLAGIYFGLAEDIAAQIRQEINRLGGEHDLLELQTPQVAEG